MISSVVHWFKLLWRETAIVLLLIFGLIFVVSAFSPLLSAPQEGPSAAYSAYNEGVVLLENGDIEKAQEKFEEAIVASDKSPDLSVSAKYNLALAMLALPDLNSDVLFQVKGLLEDALRSDPTDTDIRKNLELIQNLLRQTLEKELAEMGKDPADAEKMMDESYGQYPSDKPGRSEDNERNY